MGVACASKLGLLVGFPGAQDDSPQVGKRQAAKLYVILLFEHNLLAIEHFCQDEYQESRHGKVAHHGQDDLHRLIAHGEYPADALDAVVDGNEEQGSGTFR